MRIVIEYDSSWRNSILEDFKNKPTEKRQFKASSKSKEAIDVRNISNNTVLGVLCRLIGDQRKLYQAKDSEDFYFKDLDITFNEVENKTQTWNETAFLINKNASRPPQSGFLGILDDNEPLFCSEYAYTLWSVLDYDLESLLNFINNPQVTIKSGNVSPLKILDRTRYEISEMEKLGFISDSIALIEENIKREITKDKPRQKKIEELNDELNRLKNKSKDPKIIGFESKLRGAVNKLSSEFSDQRYFDKSHSVYPMSLYAGALYLMVSEMSKQGIDVSELVTKSGSIKGFSKRGFNGVRDFLNSLMGNEKKTTHTPYPLTKASGQLEIILDIDDAKAKELKKMIDNAGVSSFYLGKKGLAYVSDIRRH